VGALILISLTAIKFHEVFENISSKVKYSCAKFGSQGTAGLVRRRWSQDKTK